MADIDIAAQLAMPFPDEFVQTIPGRSNARYIAHGQLTQRMLELGLVFDWEVLAVHEAPDGFWCQGRLTVHWKGTHTRGRMAGDTTVITEVSDFEASPAAASSRCLARAVRHIGLGLHLWCTPYWLHTKLQEVT